MSREHAILKANLNTKTLTIEDVGSMHGTYLPADDLKLSKYQPQVVRDGDAIVFGAEVSRGPGKQAAQ
jgi:pSer/pThr/pTyr-binding forkhead associated (FHA) protein